MMRISKFVIANEAVATWPPSPHQYLESVLVHLKSIVIAASNTC